jgi:ABC-type phosphate transport system substrate-binding protein
MHSCRRLAQLAFALAAHFGAGVAFADVVVVVSASSTTAALTSAQVVEIFLGKVSRYPDGARAMPIDQAEGSAARDEFYAKLAGHSPAQIKAYWSKIIFTGRGRPPPAATSAAELKTRLAANPNAIGYMERSLVDDKLRVLP